MAGPAEPVVGGHQMCGTVRAVGPAVTRVSPGDRGVVEIVARISGECANCRSGRVNIRVSTPPMAGRIHYTTDGAFARLAIWPGHSLHVLPDNVSFEEAVLIEPTAGSVHCVCERFNLRASESVAIPGAGGRGQILMHLARVAGAPPTSVCGIQRDARPAGHGREPGSRRRRERRP